MNENLKKLAKNPKLLILVGGIGIFLIFLSSLFSSTDKKEETPKAAVYTAEQYRVVLEDEITSIVKGITGDKKPTVVVTLESGIRYSYASADETDSSSSSGVSNDQSSQSKKQSYITVRDENGGEKALVVAEIMPEIRGVAIICDGGNQEVVAEKIKNAVTSALNITTKRVYVSGGVIK